MLRSTDPVAVTKERILEVINEQDRERMADALEQLQKKGFNPDEDPDLTDHVEHLASRRKLKAAAQGRTTEILISRTGGVAFDRELWDLDEEYAASPKRKRIAGIPLVEEEEGVRYTDKPDRSHLIPKNMVSPHKRRPFGRLVGLRADANAAEVFQSSRPPGGGDAAESDAWLELRKNFKIPVPQRPQVMTFSEFFALVVTFATLNQDDLLRNLFDMFDSDGSGTLDEVEFLALWEAVSHDKQFFNQNAREAIEKFDTNGDGEIDWDEFQNMYRVTPFILYPVIRLRFKFRELLGTVNYDVIQRRKDFVDNYAKTHAGELPTKKVFQRKAPVLAHSGSGGFTYPVRYVAWV